MPAGWVGMLPAQAYVELLEAGFTRVGEFHYLHHDRDGRPYADVAETATRIAAASERTGARLTLLPVLYAHADFGGAPPTEGQRRFISDLDGFGRLVEASRAAIAGLDGAVLGVAPHSLRAVTPDELREVAALVPDGPIHIHFDLDALDPAAFPHLAYPEGDLSLEAGLAVVRAAARSGRLVGLSITEFAPADEAGAIDGGRYIARLCEAATG